MYLCTCADVVCREGRVAYRISRLKVPKPNLIINPIKKEHRKTQNKTQSIIL